MQVLQFGADLQAIEIGAVDEAPVALPAGRLDQDAELGEQLDGLASVGRVAARRVLAKPTVMIGWRGQS